MTEYIETREVLAARLHEDYLHDLPKAVTDKVFRKAWEDGHANGNHEVEMHYRELADVVTLAFDSKPKSRTHAEAWSEGHKAGAMWDYTQHTDQGVSPDANPYL